MVNVHTRNKESAQKRGAGKGGLYGGNTVAATNGGTTKAASPRKTGRSVGGDSSAFATSAPAPKAASPRKTSVGGKSTAFATSEPKPAGRRSQQAARPVTPANKRPTGPPTNSQKTLSASNGTGSNTATIRANVEKRKQAATKSGENPSAPQKAPAKVPPGGPRSKPPAPPPRKTKGVGGKTHDSSAPWDRGAKGTGKAGAGIGEVSGGKVTGRVDAKFSKGKNERDIRFGTTDPGLFGSTTQATGKKMPKRGGAKITNDR